MKIDILLALLYESIIEKTLFLLSAYILGSEIAFSIAHDKK